MQAILIAAGKFILGLFLRGAVVKFLVLGAIYYVVAWVADAVLTQLDISPLQNLQSVVSGLPTGLIWAMGVFRFDVGLPLILGAMLTKFLIRRIPFIG